MYVFWKMKMERNEIFPESTSNKFIYSIYQLIKFIYYNLSTDINSRTIAKR